MGRTGRTGRMEQTLPGLLVLGLALAVASPAAAQWLPVAPGAQTLPEGAPAVSLEDICPDPTQDNCLDPDFYQTTCGGLETGADSACNEHLVAAADAESDGLPLNPLTRCPVGLEVDVTRGQSCELPPEELQAYRNDYDMSAVTVIGNAASYAGELQAAHRDIHRGGVHGLLRNLRHTQWEGNCGVFSCEEYVREKYYAWSTFEDQAIALGDDHRAVYDLVFAPGGLVGPDLSPGEYSEIPLTRFDGSAAPALPLKEPKRNIYLRFLDIDTCAFPPESEIDTCEQLYNANARVYEFRAAYHGHAASCRGARDQHYTMTREELDSAISAVHQDVPRATSITTPQRDLSNYTNVMSWHTAASAALATSGYSDDYLLWWAERQVYFRTLWRDLERLGEETRGALCQERYTATRDAFFETSELIKRELELAAQAGCLDADHINACDWSPRSLRRELLFANDPTFYRLDPEQAGSFNAQREQDYQACIASTANNFDPVADSEWLVQAQQVQAQTGTAFCASSQPGADCDSRASYADSTRSVEAYFDAANQWFESLQLPRDPETGEPFVGDSSSDAGNQGDSNFRLDFGYGMTWAMTNLQSDKLCQATVSATGGLHADVTVFGSSTGGDSPHLALLETTVTSTKDETRGTAGFFIKGVEIFAPVDEPLATGVYITRNMDHTENLFGEFAETFVLFGFPITVRAGVTGTVGLDFRFSAGRDDCEVGNEQMLTVGSRTEFIPYADLRAYVQAGIELVIAEAGVRADLTIIALELPFVATVDARPIVTDCRGAGPGGVCLEAGASLDFGLEALSGSMSLFLDVDYGITERHYSKGLFSWPGLRVGPTNLLSTDYVFPLSVLHTLMRDGGDEERTAPAGNILSMCEGDQEPITLASLLEIVPGECMPLTVTHTVDGLPALAPERIAYVLSNFVDDEDTFYADAGCNDPTRVVELWPGELTTTVYLRGPAQQLNIELVAPGMQPMSLQIEPAGGGGPATQWLLEGPDEIAVGSCVPYSIASADAGGAVSAVSEDVVVYLSAVGGEFFSDASCSRPMDELSLLTGDAMATVFFVPDNAAPTLGIDGGALAGAALDLSVLDSGNVLSCGDGTLDPGEQCDDMDTDSRDGCSALCLIEAGFECPAPGSPCTELASVFCGDSVTEGFESCDEGAANGVLCVPDGPDPCWYCDGSCQWQAYVNLVGLFVSATTGDDGAAGTIDAPLASLTEALGRGGTSDIFVAGGTYNETPPTVTNRRVYGSYDPSMWTVDTLNWRTVIGGRYTIAGGELHAVDLAGLSALDAARGEALLTDVVIEGPAAGNPAALVNVQGILRCAGCDITLTGGTGGQRGVMVAGSSLASLTLESSNVTVPVVAEFVPAVEQRDGADVAILSSSNITGSIGVRAYYAAADTSARMRIEDSAIVGGFLGVMSQLLDTTITRSTIVSGQRVPSGFGCTGVQLWNNGAVASLVLDGTVVRADYLQGPTFALEGIGDVDYVMVHSAAIAAGHAGGAAVEVDSGSFLAAHSYFAAPGVAGLSFVHASPVTLVNNVIDIANQIYFGQLNTPIDASGITLVSNRFVKSMGTYMQVVGTGGPIQVGAAQYNTCSWGCSEALGNTVGPSGIVDVAGNDYSLDAGSALRDTGLDPTPWVAAGLVDHDMYGKARPVGLGWDVGPSEQ